MDNRERMQAKNEDVILQLHDLAMDTSASARARGLARLKKYALPGILEFVKEETLSTDADKATVSNIITYFLIFFGEMLANFTAAYKGQGTPEEVWEVYNVALHEVFLETFKLHTEASENQNAETNHLTQA